MMYRAIGTSAVCLYFLTGCGQSGPETTVVQAGTKVTYRTRTVPGLHGGTKTGELWLANGGHRFKDLFGCSPYFVAAQNDSMIVMCQKDDKRREMIVLNTADGDWFTIPNASAEIGCQGVSASRDESGILRVVSTGPSGVATVLIDTASKKTLGSTYVRSREPD